MTREETLQEFRDQMLYYLDRYQTNTGMVGDYPPILPDDRYHVAACAVEALYPDGRFPAPALKLWRDLLYYSREGDRRRPGECADDLRLWAEAELKSSPAITPLQKELLRTLGTAKAAMQKKTLCDAIDVSDKTLDPALDGLVASQLIERLNKRLGYRITPKGRSLQL